MKLHLLKAQFLLFGMLGCFMNISANSTVITQLNRSEIIPVHKPIFVNPVNIQNKSFNLKDLFQGNPNVSSYRWNQIDANKDGVFRIDAPKEDYAFVYYQFFIQSDRYTKATLDFETNQMFELWVNQLKQSTNKISDKSEKKQAIFQSTLIIEPGQKEILIKYLCERNDSLPNEMKINVSTADTTAVLTAKLTPQHPVTIEDLMTGERLGSLQLSAGGNYGIINSVTTLDNGKKKYVQKILDLKNNKVISMDEPKSSIQWMPNSERLSFIQEGQSGRELMLLDPLTRELKTLATNFPEGDYAWVPNEQSLIIQKNEKFESSKSDVHQIIMPDDRIAGWRNRSVLYQYDLANGLTQQLTFGCDNVYLKDIRFDSQKILFSKYETVLTERPLDRQSVYELDLLTHQIDTLWSQIGFIGDIQYSPNGKDLLVIGSGEAFDGIGLNILPNQISNMFDEQAFIVHLQDMSVEPITKNFDPSIKDAFWTKNADLIYFCCEDKDYIDLYSYSTKKGQFKKIPVDVDIVQSFRPSQDGSQAIYCGNSVSNTDQCYSLNLKNQESKLIYDSQKAKKDHYELGKVEDWNFTAKDSTTIYGRFYLPPYFDATKSYPMIVYYYGGTATTNRSFFHPYSMHLYAAQGYVVYVLQPSGTIGFGQEFAARHVNAWGKQTADDIIEGVQLFCKAHPFVNKSKIGCIGASYGGFMTMYLQTKTDLFAAAVSHAGISALSSYWGEGYWGYSYSEAASAYSYPWNNPQLYVEQSPLFHADKVNTPLLLLHGTADTNVPIGESIQFFNALKLLGKQVDFIQVNGENHGIAEFHKRIQWKKSIFAFFAKWLKDEPQWWEAMYPELPLK